MGALFAEMARLEAASVPAFRVLRSELADHRATADLLRGADAALVDEIRHTRITALLARRYGAEPVRPRLRDHPPTRTLEEIAVENAVESCVRETYGALIAARQARQSTDSVVRVAMAEIAVDERRHSDLAWAVAVWMEKRLSRGARARIADAALMALTDLRRTPV